MATATAEQSTAIETELESSLRLDNGDSLLEWLTLLLEDTNEGDRGAATFADFDGDERALLVYLAIVGMENVRDQEAF